MLSSNSRPRCQNKKRLTRRLSWNEDGVSSTIGTIMSMMIFLTLLSMFMNQYVPIWMEDNEATHMSNVEAQFSTLKHSVNLQILSGMLGSYDVSLYSPITLGAQGIPMFAAPTMGQLSINPDSSTSGCEVSWMYNMSSGGSPPVYTSEMLWSNSSGNVKLLVPNRYFVPQTIVYENDAIILSQAEGELVKAPPQITLRQEGSRYNMIITQVTFIGKNQSFNGFDTRGITTYLRSATTSTFNDANSYIPTTDALTGNITLNQTTQYGDAWFTYLNSTMVRYNFDWDTDYLITRSWLNTSFEMNPTELITLTINSEKISTLTINHAHMDLVIGDSAVATR
ncbi:MAG: hypothetical protein KAS16_00980 [Thermoplasmata archaeon]|nr:hypothetical protein [Thermoplasmata archaeon]